MTEEEKQVTLPLLQLQVGSWHTPGLVTVLLVEERTVILGDACNFFTFLFDEYSLVLLPIRKL